MRDKHRYGSIAGEQLVDAHEAKPSRNQTINEREPYMDFEGKRDEIHAAVMALLQRRQGGKLVSRQTGIHAVAIYDSQGNSKYYDKNEERLTKAEQPLFYAAIGKACRPFFNAIAAARLDQSSRSVDNRYDLMLGNPINVRINLIGKDKLSPRPEETFENYLHVAPLDDEAEYYLVLLSYMREDHNDLDFPGYAQQLATGILTAVGGKPRKS